MKNSLEAKRSTVVIASSFLTGFSLLLCLAMGEAATRLVHLLRDGIPFFESMDGSIGPITLDPTLGWRATEEYYERFIETKNDGEQYDASLSQGRYGFRRFGNLQSPKPKLLVIGDSFTQASGISDNRTYYALAGDRLDMEIFAYGTSGYGTLQEYLILDRYVDEIHPDLILWQFCINDFINNDHALEVASLVNNNGLTRPYWENGRAILRSPKPQGQQIREWINHHSRFLYFVISRIDRLRAVKVQETVERSIEAVGAEHPGFRHAVAVTDELMGRVRARTGATPIVAFSCYNVEPYNSALAQISAHHGIDYWEDIPDVVRHATDRGEDALTPDSHWTARGHQLVADMVVQHLHTRNLTAARQKATAPAPPLSLHTHE